MSKPRKGWARRVLFYNDDGALSDCNDAVNCEVLVFKSEAEREAYAERVSKLELEIKALSETMMAMRNGERPPTYCGWCMTCVPLDEMADHMLACKSHPLRAYEVRIEELEKALSESKYVVDKARALLKKETDDHE